MSPTAARTATTSPAAWVHIWWLRGSLDRNLIIKLAALNRATEQEVGLDDATI